jgi:hypothetical protein
MSDPLHDLRSRKRAAKREQPEPESSPPGPLIRRQGASSMPPRGHGTRMTIDDAIREGVAELRHRPKWIRL